LPDQPARILFVTSGLRLGGAEQQLVVLLRELAASGSVLSVVSLAGPGARSRQIAELGVPVSHLDLGSPCKWTRAALDIASLARRGSADLVHGWMYHGNLMATVLAARIGDSVPVVWSIRHSTAGKGALVSWGTRSVISACSIVSSRAACIVYNSAPSKDAHEGRGFCSSRGRLIVNALDDIRWRPDSAARESVRRELHLPANCLLVGMVARFSPLKGHEVFFRVAAELARRRPDVYFLLVGDGADMGNPAIRSMALGAGLDGRIRMIGARDDVPRLTAALDVSCTCSWSESSSNVISEALLCGVPAVSTDVGDARQRLGSDDLIGPVGDHLGLARRCDDLLSRTVEDRKNLALALRSALLNGSSPQEVAAAFRKVYSEALAWKRLT
jgi:glycosyltransferase involved in cell wall biosynthesis